MTLTGLSLHILRQLDRRIDEKKYQLKQREGPYMSDFYYRLSAMASDIGLEINGRYRDRRYE